MIDPVQRILSALRQHGHKPTRSGDGWSCTCPTHEDHNPSLSIHVGDDGRALVHCHTGCSCEAVCASLGLRVADLFADAPGGQGGGTPKPRRRGGGDETSGNQAKRRGCVAVATVATPEAGGRTFPTAEAAVAVLERGLGPRSATWAYRNAAGEEVGLVVRWDRPEGKTIRPVSRKPDGSGWGLGGMPEPRPLYGLPDLLAMPAGSRVYVTEGEKAADAARAVGLVTTTSPHGAKSAAKSDWSPVAGREVVILPDHDEAGERYAAEVVRLATAAGATRVRVVRLAELWPEMPEGGDMADLLDDRGGDSEPIRKAVEALADATAPEAVPSPAGGVAPVLDLDAVIPTRAAYAAEYIAALSRSTQTPLEMPACWPWRSRRRRCATWRGFADTATTLSRPSCGHWC